MRWRVTTSHELVFAGIFDASDEVSVKRIKVEVFFSPGCDRCGQVFDTLKKIAQELGSERIEWREVNVLDELDYAVELGVLSMPAIAIDGELAFKSHPSVRKLRQVLKDRLKEQTA